MANPDAKVYRSRPRALIEWAHTPYEPSSRPGDPDFTLRFLIAGQLDRNLALDILRTELTYRLEQRRTPTEIDKITASIEPIAEIAPAWAARILTLAHEHGRDRMLQHIAWLETAIAELEAEQSDDTTASTAE